MKSNDCPDCGRPVDGFSCRGCGWRDQTQKMAAGREHFLCAQSDRGLRCGNFGTFSSNTTGDSKGGAHSGPWWCFDHYPPFVHWNRGGRTAPKGGFAGLRAILDGIRPGE